MASGWIAGESLMGVGLVMWENGPELVRKLLGRCGHRYSRASR